MATSILRPRVAFAIEMATRAEIFNCFCSPVRFDTAFPNYIMFASSFLSPL